MKLNKKQIDDLCTLIDHVRSDIAYDAGGTFALNAGMDELIDTKAVQSAERAIDIIKQIILEV